MLLLALKASLKRQIATATTKDCKINWFAIEKEIANDFHVKINNLKELRCMFFCDGEVFVPKIDTQGPKPGAIMLNTKVTPSVLKTILDFINNRHAEKKSVTSTMIVGKVIEVHNIHLHHRTISRKMNLLGKQWAPIRPKKKLFSAQHHKALRNYLI